MTLLDVGPEHPHPPSDTRKLREDDVVASSAGARVSGRAFLVWLAVISVAITMAVYILKS